MSLSLAVKASLLRASWSLAAAALQLKLRRLRLAFKAGFDPAQPRAPAGQPDGGQWTDSGGGSFRIAQARLPEEEPLGRRESGYDEATPAQLARLEIARARADAAIERVRQIDPTWRPTQGLYQSTDGLIRTYEDLHRQALDRETEIYEALAGPGPYAVEAVPSRGPYTIPTEAERRALQAIGDRFGCHRCGVMNPGTFSGRWVFDHQGASALGGVGAGRLGFPHCVSCMSDQGNVVSRILRLREEIFGVGKYD